MSRVIAEPYVDNPGGSRRARALGALAGLVLLVGVAVGGWWWSHPAYFHDYGAGMSIDPRPVERSTVHVGIVHPPVSERDPEAVVTLHRAEANFAQNSAAATATFAICEGGAIGAVRGDLAEHCDAVIPVEGDAALALVRGSDQHLVMSLTPQRPGKVVVDGVTLDYTLDRGHLWRRGEQTIGVDVTAGAR